MNLVPIGIGNKEAQERFLDRNRPFLEEWENLRKLVEMVFLHRIISPPPSEEIERLSKLSDTDSEVLAADNKYNCDLLIFTLGRIAVDDFSEIIVLAGNGWGIGALKILRGMYERVVTAGYLGKNSHTVKVFVDQAFIHKMKVWSRARQLFVGIEKTVQQDKIEELETYDREARDRKAQSICKRCNQPITAEAWTRVDVESMAKTVSGNLAALYLPCYLEPTAHMHATCAGVEARIERASNSWIYRLNTEREATNAVMLGHNLLLRLLGQQIEYYNLGLADELQARLDAFPGVWDKSDQAEKIATPSREL